VSDDAGKPLTVVCCSGGGIRSASFNLGALQALAAHEPAVEPAFMVAVSGGAYIASSHCLVADESPTRPAPRDVYRPGSPEENHLRDNSRYLLPDGKTALWGAVRLFGGLLFNLALLVGWVFVGGHVLGWLLHWWSVLTGLGNGHPEASIGWAWVVPVAAVAISLVFALGHSSGRQRAAWLAMLFAVGSAALLLAVPVVGAALYDTGIHDSGNVGVVLRGIGFASPKGCAQARIDEADKSDSICGVTTGSHESNKQAAPDAYANAPRDPGNQAGGFVAFVVALAALVRAALGRLRGQSPTETGAPAKEATEATTVPVSLTARVTRTLRDALLPWLGSLLVLAVLALFFVRWTADGARYGYDAQELLHVAIALGVLLLLRVLVDVNRTSMHGFYRDRLASAYSVVRESDQSTRETPDAHLSDLRGALPPDLVLCATANIRATGEVPPGRGAISFTFTPERIGLSAAPPQGTRAEAANVLGRQDVFADSATYEAVVGKRLLTLCDAVAISGAALSPLMGKMTRPAQRFLFTVANVRLGIWMPHPSFVGLVANPPSSTAQMPFTDRMWYWVLRNRAYPSPSPWRRAFHWFVWHAVQPNARLLLAEAFGSNKVRSTWLYITDGGHFDNLGLVEALRRGATELFVFDASGDRVTSWNTLGEAIALARTEVGVEIDISPEKMVENGQVVRPWATGTFTYTWDDTPAGTSPRTGTLHLCKLGVWPGAPWDVKAYAARHPTFPTDATIQQLYDDEEFEAYRALGYAATQAMLTAPPGS